MFPISDFLDESRNVLKLGNQEDIISLLAQLAQLPEDIIDLEPTSKLLFHILTQLYQNDFCDAFLDLLDNINRNNFILVPNSNDARSFRVYIRDKFLFKLLIFNSLKYKKSLFVQTSPSTMRFLQCVLKEIALSINFQQLSLHLLKLVELILKKREDVLLPWLSILLVECMNKAAFSPITGFKQSTHNISRILLKSLAEDTKKQLCKLDTFPIKGVDVSDILKHVRHIELYVDTINKRVLKLFCNNTDSRDGSFYYESVINIFGFEQFIEEVWPYYAPYMQEFDDEGEFYQSFIKYWIPITVKRYREDFYRFIADKNINTYLKACTLYETKKKNCYDKEDFDVDVLKFLKYPNTSDVGLKTICTFIKKQNYPDQLEIQAIELFLTHYSRSEFPDDILKSLKLFVSQIFLVCHLNLNKNKEDVYIYSEFLKFVFRFCVCRIDDDASCEISAQLLKIVWDVATGCSNDLRTSYKIDRNNVYDVGANLYYQHLQKIGFWQDTFLGELLINRIGNCFGSRLRYSPRFNELVQERYLDSINGFVDLVQLCNNFSSSICLRSSEKIRTYTSLVITHRMKTNISYQDDVFKLKEIFSSNVGSIQIQNMFKCVLVLDMFSTIANHDVVHLTDLIEESLLFFDDIFGNHLNTKLNVKETKVLESFITNVAECVLKSKKCWPKLNKHQFLKHMFVIIRKSNMKRPISTWVGILYTFAIFMEQDHKNKEIKIKLLDETLNSLYHTQQGGKMRRNPETRLVIHALVLSDKNPTKPLLISSLRLILEILANPQSSDSTLSSTLNCLELLVSDNNIHQFTLPFIVDIIKHSIRLFHRTSWIIRNADLQLVRSLIERLFGVSLEENVRPKSIQDLFVLFPALASHFYDILSLPRLDDSALITLLFFSESQIKNDVFPAQSYNRFKCVLIGIIKENSTALACLAIKGYTALCLEENIPQIFSKIVNYIQNNFTKTSKNFFANLIKLLQELYNKYRRSLNRTQSIDNDISNLVNYLKGFNSFCLNLLWLKIDSFEEVTKQMILFLNAESDYQNRIWLNNHVDYLFREAKLRNLDCVLDTILSLPLSDHLQIEILSILISRADAESDFPVKKIIHILIITLIKLHNCSKFLVEAYAKTILFLYEITGDLDVPEDMIAAIRDDFQTDNMYKIFIYVTILSHWENKSELDILFCSRCVQKYINAVVNSDILDDLAGTMRQLFNCSSQKDKYHVLKLVFYLLLNESTSLEMCKFVSVLTNSQSFSVLISFVNLLNVIKLIRFVGDKTLALKLLSECYRYLESIPDEPQESDTYYLTENDFSVSKRYVKMIILKSLVEWEKSVR